MQYIIGIDIGTTNTKAVAFTTDGKVLGSAGASYPVFTDAGGRHELDPDQLLDAVVSALGGVRRGLAGERTREGAADIRSGSVARGLDVIGGLAGISFSCAFHSLIVIGEGGKPLSHAMTWADLRPSAQANALRGSEAGDRIYRHTGVPIHAMSPLCKLLWLRATQPDLFQRGVRFISIKEYIWWRLFGKYQVDHSLASATGLLDIRRLEWYPESLALAGIGPGQLSTPVPVTHMETALLPEARRLLAGGVGAGAAASGDGAGGVGEPLPEGVRFIIGGGDGAMANLGSGAVRHGETALTIGTSGAIRMTVTRPEDDPLARVFNYIISDGYYICGGATNNGGNVLQWYIDRVMGGKRTFGGTADIPERSEGYERGGPRRSRPDEVLSGSAVVGQDRNGSVSGGQATGEKGGDEDDLHRRIAEADHVAPGCEGLIFLPYLQGERAPVWNADAKGVFFGVRSLHDYRHFLRACLEGVSYSLYQIGVSLAETVGPIEHIYASGGFTRSAAWLQMVADIFGKKVYVTGLADASAIGAAMTGMYACGLISDLGAAASLVTVVQTYEPNTALQSVYQENYQIFTQLYGRLKDLM
jgi:gluconokinase